MDSKQGIMLQIALSFTDGTATHLTGGTEDNHYKSQDNGNIGSIIQMRTGGRQTGP